jgi:glycerol-3-phosphate dehydrogenase (NAD(P)+)
MARRGHDVLVWARETEVVQGLNNENRNPLFIKDLEIHPGVNASSELEQVARFADVWIWVVPAQFSATVMDQLAGVLRGTVVIVSASKGIETDTLRRMDEVAWEVLNLPASRFCCLSGPTFAREVIQGYPSAAVLACPDLELAKELQQEFSDRYLRVYANQDLIGVEVAGALKNVIAIAAGVIDGLGLGTNTQAALLTRGLHEITRLGVALGADATTFRGLAGMGDLVLTSTGGLSRNRRVGQRLGKGEKLSEILAAMHEVVEGVRTAPAASALAEQFGVEMPITEAVTRLLSSDSDPRALLDELMLRQLKVETML